MGIHDACPIHEEAYRICGCDENSCSCKRESLLKPECRGPNTCYEEWQQIAFGPDYDLARDMERGK